ncbi:PREDICTED: uncharacterized protein LOC109461537 [Branchiostoma belcheri]|uniref:Uncharacterized protein LOC109461537 n=1 Tax=Branchiostoma belcheri TaxID=7741 RepID=A0A6P4Y481_BRABE|nr:PREDICTED: uncharacterized protein LOC109461537 [Branchiostoma belcheri]
MQRFFLPRCVVFILFAILHIASGCIELLNGWDPVPVAVRARRADVVLSGTVVRTSDDPPRRRPGLTYSAQLRVRSVLKGKDRLQEIPAISDEPKVYNVSNFGRRAECYSEVVQGDSYIFFLGIFREGELAARYDDIFGATADPTRGNEEEILLALGVKDLLRFVDASNVPPSKERPLAFLFHHIRELPFPTAILFPKAFPSDFAVIATAKPREGSRGFLTTVASSSGETQIAIEVGNMPTFRYAELGGEPTSRSPRFSVDLADGKWHQFSFRVQGSEVTFYMDCRIEMTAVIQRSKTPHIDNTGILTIGPNFQGELEQLVFSDDPNDAALQCQNGAKPSEEDTKCLEEVTTFANDIQPLMPESEANPRFATSAIPDVTSRKMASEIQKPVGSCARACKNGGLCTSENTCRCPDGYTGQACEQALCRLPCENGGTCTAPDRCVCTRGYVGPRCRKDITKQHKRNGNQAVVFNSRLCFRKRKSPACLKSLCGVKGCQNGGKCSTSGKCLCRNGFHGSHCQHRRCKTYQRSSEPYRRGYKKKFTAVAKVKCGPFGLGTCVKERSYYKMIYKTFYRTVYACGF